MNTTRLEDIHQEVKDLRGEVKDFAAQVVTNKNDLSWVKGSLKIGLTFVLSMVAGIVLYLVKANI